MDEKIGTVHFKPIFSLVVVSKVEL